MSTEFDQNRKSVIERLKQANVTPTQQRVEIAQILFARPQHLSAEQVLAVVNADSAVVSKATVYNTLGLFASKGLINEVIVDPTKIFYDSNTSGHHHFSNVDTGELTDVDSDAVNLEDLPPLPEGTQAEAVDVIIRVRQSD
jgi:Fur family iron response transcriptional regulator